MVEHQPSKLDTWVRFPSPALCDSGVVGNARPCQGRDRGFEPRLSLCRPDSSGDLVFLYSWDGLFSYESSVSILEVTVQPQAPSQLYVLKKQGDSSACVYTQSRPLFKFCCIFSAQASVDSAESSSAGASSAGASSAGASSAGTSVSCGAASCADSSVSGDSGSEES